MPRTAIPKVALIYDFDRTLSPRNMQEYNFLPDLEIKPAKFWTETGKQAREHKADDILTYMILMLERAREKNIKVDRKSFARYGSGINLFKGVEAWFDRINDYAKCKKLKAEHYIISSGLREMIKGTKIGKKFKHIYASGFWYDQHNVAKRPAMAINYTTKTQFVFRINKGCLDEADHTKINKWTKPNERDIPFDRMIFVGDGDTDVPCMRLIKDQGGFSIAVYPPHSSKKKNAERLKKEGRVDFVAPADYSKGRPLDRAIKARIDLIVAQCMYQKEIGQP